MEQHKIDRINFLAGEKKVRELTKEERDEHEGLRREYIDSVKASLSAALDNTYIVDHKGNKRKIQKKK